MPMIAAALKTKLETTIYNGLKEQFSTDTGKGKEYTPEADAHWLKMAKAISGIAMDIVTEITSNAMVMPGQQIVGVGGGIPGPVSGSTVSPGTIM